jgi:hypothetical protein
MIDYLLAALNLEVEGSPIYEIGGSDIVSYGDILREYSRQRGLRCLMSAKARTISNEKLPDPITIEARNSIT